MEVVWTKMAEDDLIAIFEFIAKDNLQSAIAMDAMFRNTGNGLSDFPQIGKVGRLPGTREFVVHPNYILVYRLKEECIQVLNIIHTAKQYPPE